MAQILDRPGVGAQLGSMIGQSLGSGISQLIQNKMQKMKTIQGLQALGVPQSQASQLSNLPPDVAKLVYPQLLKNMQREKDMQALSSQYGMQPQSGIQELQQGAQPEQSQQEQMQQPESSTGYQQELPTEYQSRPSTGYQPGLTAMQALSMGTDIDSALKLEQKEKETNLKMQRELKKDDIERKRYLTEQENKMWDRADPYINELMKTSKSSKIQNMDLDRLEEIGDKVSSPAWDSFLKGSGFDLAALRSPESSEFESIKMSFMKDMKKYFGGNVSTREMEGFLLSLPNLSQSQAGRNRVIANLRRLNNVSIQYAKSAKQAIKGNNGIPPRDIQFKVDKIMKQRVKKVADTFRRDLNKPIPELTSGQRFATAGAHAAGSIIGAVPKLIGGLSGLLGRLGS